MTLSRALFKVKKLDRRHKAYPYFTYYIEDTWRRANENPDINFFTLREWFWVQFGPSKEFKYWKDHMAPILVKFKRSDNDQWCWDTEFGHRRIYVTDKSLTAFNLKWM